MPQPDNNEPRIIWRQRALSDITPAEDLTYDDELEAVMQSVRNQYIPDMACASTMDITIPPKPPPPPEEPRYRIITDKGAVFDVDVFEFDVDFNFKVEDGHRLRLAGNLVMPEGLPAFAQPETGRRINVPD